MNMEAFIRPLTPQDLPQVAQIHCAAFPQSALSRLGVEATRRYYEWQLLGPHQALALGCVAQGRLAGFCFAGVFNGAMSGFLRRNRSFLLRRLLTRPWLFASAMVRERAQLALGILRRRRGAAPGKIAVPGFGVLAIAVLPEHQGRGLGKLLMNQVESAARQAGFTQMTLSVHAANQQAILFYQRLGWRKLIEDGVWRNGIMIKDLA